MVSKPSSSTIHGGWAIITEWSKNFWPVCTFSNSSTTIMSRLWNYKPYSFLRVLLYSSGWGHHKAQKFKARKSQLGGKKKGEKSGFEMSIKTEMKVGKNAEIGISCLKWSVDSHPVQLEDYALSDILMCNLLLLEISL